MMILRILVILVYRLVIPENMFVTLEFTSPNLVLVVAVLELKDVYELVLAVS